MPATKLRAPAMAALAALTLLAAHHAHTRPQQAGPLSETQPERQTESTPAQGETTMNVHYLEIVTPDVDETCDALARTHGIRFGDPIPALGNARTASLEGGGRIGVRAPMRDTEEPVVRPYVLVDDIAAAVAAAEAAGAEIALPPMPLPGEGQCAVYILGGIQHGLWQN